jgi:FAD/FMN-containing dehydrogenase
MASPNAALLTQLAQLLGPKGYTEDANAMAPWLSDWRGRVHGKATALLSPASTAEVQEIVRLAGAAGAQLTLQGGNSGQCAGATPDERGHALLLSLRRMNTIRAIDAHAQLLQGDAGVILAHAHEAAQQVGLRFPLTLGGKGSATLGGLVSTNAGGTQVLRHGTMRALTAGLEVVLADGSLLDVMQPLEKDNQGPDPKQLFIGGEGVFGIITGVTLRLVPDVALRTVGWACVETPGDALTALRQLQAALGNALEGFEILPQRALDHVIDHIPGLRSPVAQPARWHVLIEVAVAHGEADPTEALASVLGTLLETGTVSDAVIAASESQADDFWRIRESISEAERALGPAIQHDISVPVSRMPTFLDDVPVAIAEAFTGATSLGFGHLGDGNIHFHVRPPAQSDALHWIAEHGAAVNHLVYGTATQMGGSISAEHGIGRVKRAMFGELGDPVRIAMLRALKNAMDPAGLFNPGVLLP